MSGLSVIRVVPFALTALSYLGLGGWVVLGHKNLTQRLYGFLCLATALWQSTWVFIFMQSGPSLGLYSVLQVCFTGITFIPAIFYHFVIEFTHCREDRRWLPSVYVLGAVLAASVWMPNGLLNGFNVYHWGLAAKAGRLHPVFAILVAGVIVRSLVLLRRMDHEVQTSELQRRQSRFVQWATVLYIGGSLDLISNYGFSVFPVSFLFSGAAVMLFGTAMFRYEFLAIAAPRETEEDFRRREAASTEMKRLGMVAAFPLVSQGELLGYLLLGEKMSEEAYSKEDLLLLRIVANQAALAYQRVRYLEMAVHGARTEMLGEIAGGFAHEIKTPLANISLPAELSIMDLTDVEQGKRKLEDILPELKARLKDIMNQSFKAGEKIEAIRQFSKPGQVKLEAVDLSKILQNSLALLDHLLRRTDIKIRAEFPSTLPFIRGDAKQLEIVFVNLIKNAAEAMSHNVSPALGRELWLKGREDGNWIVASVKDSGPGIKRTDFSHLFEAYFTTKGSEGTGMGLFLSQQVIKAHGGSIDVRSEEGKGTEFIIRLPKHSDDQSGYHQAA